MAFAQIYNKLVFFAITLQVMLQPIAFSSEDTTGCASTPDARLPIVPSASSGHRMQLPWHFPAHGCLTSFPDDLIPRDHFGPHNATTVALPDHRYLTSFPEDLIPRDSLVRIIHY